MILNFKLDAIGRRKALNNFGVNVESGIFHKESRTMILLDKTEHPAAILEVDPIGSEIFVTLIDPAMRN